MMDPQTQVLFYDRGAGEFAFSWAAAAPQERWLFPLSALGPQFLYYVCLRLQQRGQQAAQVLIAAAGQQALFSAADAPAGSEGAVGLLPLATPPADFGTTLGSFAPGATLTLLTRATAGDQTFEGVDYRGADLIGMLAIYTNGKVVAADQAVALNADGTASTTGNIWLGDPQNGSASILFPAPGGGESLRFPLGTDPVS